MSAVVELHEVSKRFGQQLAVDRVSLSIDPGERVALLGHNGAGKTTLMKLMLGLSRPSGGAIQVLGGGGAQGRRELGFLPENVAFDDAMTGLELMRFYARLKHARRRQCVDLLEQVGLGVAAQQRVRTYSKGMRQRLGLAQALLGSPRLLMLDEPTSGLDPASRQRFYEILRDLARSGSAVLLSSHLLTELEERTDRIAIMDRGSLVAVGSLEELRRQARLPIRFRLRVSQGRGEEVVRRLSGVHDLRLVNGSALSFSCLPDAKMAIIREIGECGTLVDDIGMAAPSLDDVYASFVGREEAE